MSKKSALKLAAEIVRQQGQRKDSVLAHISPAEAEYLKKKYGGDKNPKTGLPQFGLFRKAEKFLRKPVKAISAPAAALIGNMVLPGAGAVIGGAIGKAATSKGNIGQNLLKGALIGAGTGYIAPQVGGLFGAAPTGAMGKIMGVGAPSFLNTLGVPNLVGGGGALAGLFGGAGAPGVAEMTGYGPEMAVAAGAGAGGLGLGNMLGLAGLGSMLYGVKKGKSEYKPYEGPTLQQRMIAQGMTPPKIVPYVRPKPYKRKQKHVPDNLFSNTGGENVYFEDIPWPGEYAHGGNVEDSYFHGASGGQDDNRHTKMPEKSYVIDATTLSLYGDGNSEAGLHKLNKLKAKSRQTAEEHGYERPENLRMIDAMVSDGEDIWTPEEVFGFGLLAKGNGDKGVTAMNTFRKNLRKQKGVKSFLPPKSKHVSYYLGEENGK